MLTVLFALFLCGVGHQSQYLNIRVKMHSHRQPLVCLHLAFTLTLAQVPDFRFQSTSGIIIIITAINSSTVTMMAVSIGTWAE
jgi:hypothetical protein